MIQLFALALIPLKFSEGPALFTKGLVPIRVDEGKEAIDCWKAIDKSIRGKQVVGIGECTHGSHEIFVVKSNLIKHLILTQGFRGLAMELPYSKSFGLDDFVTKGDGDAKTAVQSCGFWTAANEEFLSLIVWIRNFNIGRKPSELVHVLGADMQETFVQSLGLQSLYKKAELNEPNINDANWHFYRRMKAEQDKENLGQVMRNLTDQAIAQFKSRSDLESIHRVEIAQITFEQALANWDIIDRGENLYDMQISVGPFLAKAIQDVSAMASTTGLSKSAQEIILGLTKVPIVPQPASNLTAAATDLEKLDPSPKGKQFVQVLRFLALATTVSKDRETSFRDIKMAENVLTLKQKIFGGKPTIFWAHNSHVSKGELNGNLYFSGAHLNKAIGNRYYPIGFAFNSGGFSAYQNDQNGLEPHSVGPTKEGAVETLLHQLGKPAFFADMDSTDSDTKKWLNMPHPTRTYGSNFDPKTPEIYYENLVFAKWFKGMIYIDKLTPAFQIPRE